MGIGKQAFQGLGTGNLPGLTRLDSLLFQKVSSHQLNKTVFGENKKCKNTALML